VSRTSAGYTVAFSAIICVVCAVLVSSAAVSLRDRQQANAELDRKRNVLVAAGEAGPDESLSRDEIESRFSSFEIIAIDLQIGEQDPDFTIANYNQDAATSDPGMSRSVQERNAAQVTRVPNHALVYRKVDDNGNLELLVLPIHGKGLWSTMYGFIALGDDLQTVRGLTYYQHGETPGLGGEVDNPRWKALWPGRKVYDDQGDVALRVARGAAGPPASDPYRVDGLAGATITARGVTGMIEFWLGDEGYGPYLERLRKERGNGTAS
jgi:Na+-transporting NADH:ubiquinone oxidoreductase subunit C